jgi:hypothetical protein
MKPKGHLLLKAGKSRCARAKLPCSSLGDPLIAGVDLYARLCTNVRSWPAAGNSVGQ